MAGNQSEQNDRRFCRGILIALLIALAFFAFTTIDIPLVKLLTVTVILSVFGQIGDLAQSAFKRHYGVKDSGNIMPGHGEYWTGATVGCLYCRLSMCCRLFNKA